MAKKRKSVRFPDDSEYTKYKGPRPKNKMVEKPRSESNPNIGPRTESARKAVILMNKLGHRPKSVIIQTHDEVVVQVRGDYDDLVKKLRKKFQSKGKETGTDTFRTHDWKLKGLGLMNVYFRDGNSFCSVRFKDIPGFGVKFLEEEEAKPAQAEAPAASAPEPSKPEPIPEDLDAVLLN